MTVVLSLFVTDVIPFICLQICANKKVTQRHGTLNIISK